MRFVDEWNKIHACHLFIIRFVHISIQRPCHSKYQDENYPPAFLNRLVWSAILPTGLIRHTINANLKRWSPIWKLNNVIKYTCNIINIMITNRVVANRHEGEGKKSMWMERMLEQKIKVQTWLRIEIVKQTIAHFAYTCYRSL